MAFLFLDSSHGSKKRKAIQTAKFYFFDCGVVRSLKGLSTIEENTVEFGHAFEHFIFLEMYRQCQYKFPDWEMSYLQSKEGAEIDFILDRPGQSTLLIAVKSKETPNVEDTRHLEMFRDDFANCELFLVTRQQTPRKIGHVMALPWQQFLTNTFGA